MSCASVFEDIWSGTNYALNNYNETQPIDFDYDDLYTTNPDEFVYWGSGPNRHMHDLATFQSLTGQEPHGLNVEPGFAGAMSGDYTLDPASEMIDAGVIIPGINDDYVGTGPDVGAYEYQGYGFTLTTTPSSRAISPGGVARYDIGVQTIGGFTHTVTLVAASPSPSLTLSLAPTALDSAGQGTLTLTDTHPGPTLLPGLWYTIPITGTGDGVTQTTSVNLLVGGARVYLPVILRGRP